MEHYFLKHSPLERMIYVYFVSIYSGILLLIAYRTLQ